MRKKLPKWPKCPIHTSKLTDYIGVYIEEHIEGIGPCYLTASYTPAPTLIFKCPRCGCTLMFSSFDKSYYTERQQNRTRKKVVREFSSEKKT